MSKYCVVKVDKQLLKEPKSIRIPKEGQLDQAWILATVLGDHLSRPSQAPAGLRDPVGQAVGYILGRLAKAGFEEVAIFSLRRVWRNLERTRRIHGHTLMNTSFMGAIQSLSENPSFQTFLEAMHREGEGA